MGHACWERCRSAAPGPLGRLRQVVRLSPLRRDPNEVATLGGFLLRWSHACLQDPAALPHLPRTSRRDRQRVRPPGEDEERLLLFGRSVNDEIRCTAIAAAHVPGALTPQASGP